MSFSLWPDLLSEMRECVRRRCDPLAEALLAMTCKEEAMQRSRYYETALSGPRTPWSYSRAVARCGSDEQLLVVALAMALEVDATLLLDKRGAQLLYLFPFVMQNGWTTVFSVAFLMEKPLKRKRDAAVLSILHAMFGERGCAWGEIVRLVWLFNTKNAALCFVLHIVSEDLFAPLWYDVSAYWFVRTTHDTQTLVSWRNSSRRLSDWAVRSGDTALMLVLAGDFRPNEDVVARRATPAFLKAADDRIAMSVVYSIYRSKTPLATIQWAFARGLKPDLHGAWSYDDDPLGQACFGYADPRITEWLATQLGIGKNELRALWEARCRRVDDDYIRSTRDAIRFIEHFGFGWSVAFFQLAWEDGDTGALRWYLTRPGRYISPSNGVEVDIACAWAHVPWLRARGWIGTTPDGSERLLHATTHEPLPGMRIIAPVCV